MSVTRIATRYAKSLIDLALEQKKLEPVYTDIKALATAAANRELYLLLKSPIVHADKKMAVLNALFKDRMDTLTLAYLQLLVNKGREMYLPEIAAAFVEQYKIMMGITTVRVTSAAPLSDAVLDDLRKRILASGITNATLDLVTQVNPALVGGFILEFDNKRYDASVANKLAELKADFMKNQYIREF